MAYLEYFSQLMRPVGCPIVGEESLLYTCVNFIIMTKLCYIESWWTMNNSFAVVTLGSLAHVAMIRHATDSNLIGYRIILILIT